MSPIKDPSVYPEDWPEIRERILKRAENRCECEGECGRQHSLRELAVKSRCVQKNGEINTITEARVVLTIAHLDHDASLGNHSEENLKAMCQGCHLRFDGWHRQAQDEAARAVGRLF